MVSREDLTNQIISKYQKKKVKNYIQRQPPSDFEYNPWEFEHPWVRGLCNCTEQCDELCYSFCCYPCFSCHLAWRLNESCWIACCLPGYLAILRTKVRTAFRIEVFIKSKYILVIHAVFIYCLLLGFIFL